MRTSIKHLFYKNTWTCAYRVIEQESLLEAKCSPQHFNEISFPNNCWGADPFLLFYDDKYYIYCEFTNEKKGKAVIAFKEIYPIEGKKWRIAYESEKHISYPCIFRFGGDIFMIPETSAENKIIVLKFDPTCEKWFEYSTIIKGEQYVDTTFVCIDGKPYIFLYKINEDQFRELYIGELSENLKCLVSIDKIKEYNGRLGRPAGSIIEKDGLKYRVVQPGVLEYGEKIELYSFSLVKEKYEESLIKIIEPTNVDVGGKQLIGLHTYNRIDSIEVIDVLVKSKFRLFRPFFLLFKRLGIFGYGMYEKKGKMLGKI